MAPFYGWGSAASGQSQFKDAVYFLPVSSQKLVNRVDKGTLRAYFEEDAQIIPQDKVY